MRAVFVLFGLGLLGLGGWFAHQCVAASTVPESLLWLIFASWAGLGGLVFLVASLPDDMNGDA